MTRMLERAPAEMLPAERLREKVFWTGSHMFDCGRRGKEVRRINSQMKSRGFRAEGGCVAHCSATVLACPEQYQTSPNVTPVRTTGAGAPAQPVQAALIVKLPPAGIGGRSAFHEGIGMAQGVKVFMSYGGHTALGHGRTPQSGPNGCCVVLSVAATVITTRPVEASVTVTETPVPAKSRYLKS